MQQVSTQQPLANLQFVGASVQDSDEQSVDVGSGGSGLESVQKWQEIVALAPMT